MGKADVEFSDQVRIFSNEMLKAFDYTDLEEVQTAKFRMYSAGEILDADIPIFICYASYIGSLKRIAYYKFVHQRGFDVRALADACTLTLMFSGVYRFEFEPYIRRKEIRQLIDRTRYPKWTIIGLLGGSMREIVDLGDEFSKYMDSLGAK